MRSSLLVAWPNSTSLMDSERVPKRNGVAFPIPAGRRPVRADEVGDGSTHGGRHCSGGPVVDLAGEDGDRQPARIGIARDEGIEGLQVHIHGNIGVGEDHAAEGIGCCERAVAEPGVVLVGDGTAVASLVLEVLERAFENATCRILPRNSGIERKERPRLSGGRYESFRRPVHDFPVAQASSSRK